MLKRSTRRRGASISEFPVVLFILFLIILFPLINMLGICMSGVSAYLITMQTAQAAAHANTFNEGLTAAVQTAQSMATTSIAKFAKLSPIGGASNSGITLYVEAINTSTSQIKLYGPDTPVTPPIDTVNCIYEIESIGTFQAKPFLAMAGMPFVGNVPGIGQPFPFCFRCKRAVENAPGLAGPGTLAATYALGAASAGSGAPLPSTVSATPIISAPGGGNPVTYITLVPVNPSNPNAGYFLMDFYAVYAQPGGGVNFKGTFLTSSQAQTIVTGTQFNANNYQGLISQITTNPGSNIPGVGVGSSWNQPTSYYATNPIVYANGQPPSPNATGLNVTAAQAAVINQTYNNLIQTLISQGVVPP